MAEQEDCIRSLCSRHALEPFDSQQSEVAESADQMVPLQIRLVTACIGALESEENICFHGTRTEGGGKGSRVSGW